MSSVPSAADPLSLFKYQYLDNQAPQTLVTLPGTGGSMQDFWFLDELLASKFNILGVQGNVDEHGLQRFFKRLAIGVFDQESLKSESNKFLNFMQAWSKKNQQSPDALLGLGYSNGANFLCASTLLGHEVFSTQVWLHPMLPFPVVAHQLDLSSQSFLVTHGVSDPFVTADQQKTLNVALQTNQASLEVAEFDSGHQLSQPEIAKVVSFLNQKVWRQKIS